MHSVVQPVFSGTLSLADLVQRLGAEGFGNLSLEVQQLVHPRMAQSAQDLALAVEPGAFACLAQSPCQTAIIAEGMPTPPANIQGYMVVKRPRYAMATLLEVFNKPLHLPPAGIHPTAVIEASAQIAPDVHIGAFVYVGEKVKIATGTVVMPHVTVGAEAIIGENCLLHPGVRIGERVVLKNRVILHHNASIGADGFSYVTPEAGSIESAKASGKVEAQNTELVRINSIGTVVLEEDVEVGAGATIDRATMGVTLIKKGTKIDNLVMIGHNNTVGENCLIVSQVGISGSCKIGDRAVIAGQAGLKDHIQVGNDAIVMAQSGVMRDVEERSVVIGAPAVPQREFFQTLAYSHKLKEMYKEMKSLQKRLAALEGQQSNTPVQEEESLCR